jgi:ubiquinone/menaquinone biosynthesis C-methylase UbiE
LSTKTPASSASIDLAAVKNRQQVAWSSGDYAVIGTTLQIVGEQLCEALDLRAGSCVLDVAAGNGNTTLAAARRWCEVTSTDYVASLLQSGRARALAEGQIVLFQEADAEHLPFPDASFDVVLSAFGVMFTPDQQRAASELARVCRVGGKIGLANWTPESFIGQVFATLGRYVQAPSGVPLPMAWGNRATLEELLGGWARSIVATSRDFVFRYRSAAHWVEVFRNYYGPMVRVFSSLDAERQQHLTQELLELLAHHNRSDDRTLVVPSEYLEVVVTRT